MLYLGITISTELCRYACRTGLSIKRPASKSPFILAMPCLILFKLLACGTLMPAAYCLSNDAFIPIYFAKAEILIVVLTMFKLSDHQKMVACKSALILLMQALSRLCPRHGIVSGTELSYRTC